MYLDYHIFPIPPGPWQEGERGHPADVPQGRPEGQEEPSAPPQGHHGVLADEPEWPLRPRGVSCPGSIQCGLHWEREAGERCDIL